MSLSIALFKEELKEQLNRQHSPIYTWSVDQDEIRFFDVCQQLIFDFTPCHAELCESSLEEIQMVVNQALKELEEEGYLILEDPELLELEVEFEVTHPISTSSYPVEWNDCSHFYQSEEFDLALEEFQW